MQHTFSVNISSGDDRADTVVPLVFSNQANQRTDASRRAVRAQAARASAAARKQTIQLTRNGHYRRGKPIDDSTNTPSGSREIESASSVESLLPSVLGQGRVDPFHTWPTHDSTDELHMPRLMDTYLTFIVPATGIGGEGDDYYGRAALRGELWPGTFENPSLFWSNLLVAATTKTFSLESQHAAPYVAYLRQMASTNITTALSDFERTGRIEAPVIGAMSLVSAWEYEYGDKAIHDTHLKSLLAIAETQKRQHWQTLSQTLVDFVLWTIYKIPITAGKCSRLRPSILPQSLPRGPVAGQLPVATPSGFLVLTDRNHLFLDPKLSELVADIACFDTASAGADDRLKGVVLSLVDWRPPETISLITPEKEVERQGEATFAFDNVY